MIREIDPRRSPPDEEIVTFTSEGNRLVGILSHPATAAPTDLGVLLFSPGLKQRSGPHRLQVKLARFYAGLGLPVFRFDFHGTGDSEGELPGVDVPDLHDRIQNGYFRKDALAALEVFCERSGVERVIACGLCGGAITSVYAAESDSRVSGIVGFQLPVKVIDSATDYADQITGEFSDFILSLYLKKLLKLSAWKNFLSGRSEYSLIWKTTVRRLASLLGLRRARTPGSGNIPAGMNRIFLESYFNIAGVTNMIWIYSDVERARYDFEGEFETECLSEGPRPYEKVVIPESNHEFSPDEAQVRLLEVIEDWLRRHYGASLRKAG